MAKKSHIKKYSIIEFCKFAGIRKKSLADGLSVTRQQIRNWEAAKEKCKYGPQPEDGDHSVYGNYFVEYNTKTGEASIINSQKVVNKCNIKVSA